MDCTNYRTTVNKHKYERIRNRIRNLPAVNDIKSKAEGEDMCRHRYHTEKICTYYLLLMISSYALTYHLSSLFCANLMLINTYH